MQSRLKTQVQILDQGPLWVITKLEILNGKLRSNTGLPVS